MQIYGVAVLAACVLVGKLIGTVLGKCLHIDGNIGGVAFAMILLILINMKMKRMGYLDTTSEKGMLFWSAMYIPIVIAMSSIQNVKAALSGGWVALIVGLVATGFSYLMVPLIAKIGQAKGDQEVQKQQE